MSEVICEESVVVRVGCLAGPNLARERPSTTVSVVANKIRRPSDANAVAEFVDALGLPLLGSLPWSEDVVEADRSAASLIDFAPDGDVVAAVRSVAERLDVL